MYEWNSICKNYKIYIFYKYIKNKILPSYEKIIVYFCITEILIWNFIYLKIILKKNLKGNLKYNF